MAGDGISYGKESGLTVGQFAVSLFNNQMQAHLNDEDLAEVMTTEFPKSSTEYRRYISMYRNRNNRGDFACQSEPPFIPIPMFGKDGKVVETRCGPAPRTQFEEPIERNNGDS